MLCFNTCMDIEKEVNTTVTNQPNLNEADLYFNIA